MKISGLILAAGLSGRMNSFKPVMKINGKSFVGIVAENLLRVCDNLIVVTGYQSEQVENALEKSDRIRFVYNQNYEEGMFSSLKIGLSESMDSAWVIYHFVDQPLIPKEFYREFIEQIEENYNWIQPSFNSVKGHPVLLKKSLFRIIIDTANNYSLKEISHNPALSKKIWDCRYPQILTDLDTLDDFNKLKPL
ncbi:MAG TPA: nucleotidyltransferase family protein [Melioribacteraceae bacterium]|nr:nucleotidyltransferase family protein [Melioribacteraceae bacterium]